MLKKILADIVILICAAALYLSTSRPAMQHLYELRTNNAWWGAYDWLYGNLSGMSHLDFEKRFRTPEDYSRVIAPYNGPKNIALFLHGDSHTRHPVLRDTDFAGVADFHFINEHGKYYYHIDTTKKNILIIEIAENHVRMNFSELDILNEINDTVARKTAFLDSRQRVQYSSMVPDLSFDCFFNRYINQNLEFQLFNYNFQMPMFGLKASINYRFFHRASGDVVISDDGKFLFYKETAQTTGTNSAFSPIPDAELTRLIDNLNTVYDHYRGMGFREIYLSIVPNAITIMQPEGYNNLIPKIQNDRRLKMKVIDMYTIFKNSPDVNYLRGDTHWNNEGFKKWLAKVDEILLAQNSTN